MLEAATNMTALVFIVVLFAAVLHASWNALLKSQADKPLAMTAVVLGHLPFGLAVMALTPMPARESWPYLIAGAVLHIGYQMFLLFSYRIGDLTHVYPIARGVAPLIVAAVSVALLGATLTGSETFAIALIGVGILSLAFVRHTDGLRNPHAAATALVTGCFIAAYSLVDGSGARVSSSAFGYFAWLSVLNALVFAPVMMVWRPGTVRRAFTDGAHVAAIGGGASYLAYSLVVWAFTQAPIALVTALRETSIVFALLIGVIFLRERLNLVKLLSTMTTLGGAILLRLAR